MAPPQKGQQGPKATPRGARGGAPVEHAVTEPLRLLLHEVETRLGLFPAHTGFDGYGRFHAPVLLPPNAPLPAPMGKLFATELGALERIGKPTARCHAAALKPLKVYCLPYYYYDGFNALFYAEQQGSFFAAWKEQETNAETSPTIILAAGPFEKLQPVLRRVVALPA